MFVSSTRRVVDPAALRTLGNKVRPISDAQAQRLPIDPALRDLLPGGLRRDTTVGVTAGEAGGGSTLALSLLAAASQTGSWCAAVALPDLGAVAAEQLGIDLGRLVCIPHPGDRWAQVVADLLGGFDLVLLGAPRHPRTGQVRRLCALLRERRSVLIVVDMGRRWPQPFDLTLRVDAARWVQVDPGEDCLRRRHATVAVAGRRAAQGRSVDFWLPAGPAGVASA